MVEQQQFAMTALMRVAIVRSRTGLSLDEVYAVVKSAQDEEGASASFPPPGVVNTTRAARCSPDPHLNSTSPFIATPHIETRRRTSRTLPTPPSRPSQTAHTSPPLHSLIPSTPPSSLPSDTVVQAAKSIQRPAWADALAPRSKKPVAVPTTDSAHSLLEEVRKSTWRKERRSLEARVTALKVQCVEAATERAREEAMRVVRSSVSSPEYRPQKNGLTVTLPNGDNVGLAEARKFLGYYCALSVPPYPRARNSRRPRLILTPRTSPLGERFSFKQPKLHQEPMSGETHSTSLVVNGRKIGFGDGPTRSEADEKAYLDCLLYLGTCDPDLWDRWTKELAKDPMLFRALRGKWTGRAV